MLELRLGLSSAPATAGDACTDSQDYYGDSIHADTATATSDQLFIMQDFTISPSQHFLQELVLTGSSDGTIVRF